MRRADPQDAPIRAAKDLGFEPTSAQARIKAQFWRKFREDPSMDPSTLGPAGIRKLIDCGELDAWWKQANFKEWFLHQDVWRDSAQATFEKTIRQIEKRLDSESMSDKDLLVAAKLLAELTNNIPRVGAKPEDQKPKGQLTGEDALKRLEPLLRARGWIPPKVLEAEASDVTPS